MRWLFFVAVVAGACHGAEPVAVVKPAQPPVEASSSVPVAPPAPSASTTTTTIVPNDVSEAASKHSKVAIVRVDSHGTFQATVPNPGSHPIINLTVVRWIKPTSGYTPATFTARIMPSDPKLEDGKTYVLVFDDGFGGKALPSTLDAVVAHEIDPTDVDRYAEALRQK